MKRLVLALSAILLFNLTSWAQAAPANSPGPGKPAARAKHHKVHSAGKHARHHHRRHTSA